MAQLKACHLTELKESNGMSIFIPHSKTDIFRNGSYAYISHTESRYSPISILKSYMSRCNIEIGQNVFIFTALSFHSSSKSYKPLLNRPLSYTRCRELFLDAIKQIGIREPKRCGLHSMRSGGATHLTNKGIPEELVMQHGRWKTTIAKNRYTQRDVEQRMMVSGMLNSK